MALFDSVINGASEKFGLGDKAGTLLSALLALMTNQETGGFSGFMDRFKQAGLGDTATSWITSGDNTDISSEQLESAIGADTISVISEQVGIDKEKTTSALAFMTPKVVDNLTPNGELPDDDSLLSKIGGFLTGAGGMAAGVLAGAAGGSKAVAGTVANKASDAAESVGDAAGAVGDKITGAFDSVTGGFDGDGDDDGGSILKWLLPLILLGVLIAIGFYACRDNKPVVTDTNANTNSETNVNSESNKETTGAVDSSFKIEAKDGKYTITGVVKDEATKKAIMDKLTAELGEGNVNFDGLKVDANAKDFGPGWWDNFGKMLPNLKDWKTGTLAFVGSAVTEASGLSDAATTQLKSLFGTGWTLPASMSGEGTADRKLSEVALPDGTKLQAYPGGIEDQLIKFVSSDEYKNATDEDLKNKWFDFDDLNFKFGTTELVAESKRQLDNVVAILKAYPELKVKIGGYTDKKGDDAANKALSDKRAKAVQAALAKEGVGEQVTGAEGYGEEFAKVDESASDEERASDRKTSIRLVKSEEKPAADAEKKE